MGYLHIANMYRAEGQVVLLFKEVYALEKVHGTSAHVSWKDGQLTFFSGGEKQSRFMELFDKEALAREMSNIGPDVVVYGEAYGGSQQAQAWRYGKQLRFVAFDVKVGDCWLDVPNAEQVARRLGLDFVAWRRVEATVEALNAMRDLPSDQAQKNGVEGPQPREGVVVRPLVELTMNNGDRVIAKHKRDEERETRTTRQVDDPAKLRVLKDAEAIALEWVTETRMDHVLDKVPNPSDIGNIRLVIEAMVEDVMREGAGEVVDNKEARKAIGSRAAVMFRARLHSALR